MVSAITFVDSVYLVVVEVYSKVAEHISNTELVICFLAVGYLPEALHKLLPEGSAVKPQKDDNENQKGWLADKNGNSISDRFMTLCAL